VFLLYDFEISLDRGVADFVYIKKGKACGISAFRQEKFPVFYGMLSKRHNNVAGTSTAGLVWFGTMIFAFQLDVGFVGRR